MNNTLVVVGNGLALGVIYLLMAISSRWTWPVVVALGFVTLRLNRVRFTDFVRLPEGLGQGVAARLWQLLLVYSAMILGRSLVEQMMLPESVTQPYLGLDILLKNTVFAIVLAAAFMFSRTLDARGALWVVIIAVGFNASINLILDRLMIFSDNVFSESRFDNLEARWRPPIIRSNAYFAMACLVSVGLLINSIRAGIVPILRRPLLLVALSVAGTAGFISALRCQFRAHLLAVAATVLLLAFRGRWSLRALGFGTLAVMVVFPTLFASAVGHRVIDGLAPEKILSAIGSNSTGAFDFSERTALYEYGWDNLRQLRVFLIGEGPVMRDAQGAIGDLGKEGYRMPYHGALMDFLMQSGTIIGLLVVVGLGTLLALGFDRLDSISAENKEHRFIVVSGLINLILWMSLSIIDSGLSAFETLWLAVIPLFGALATTGRKESAATIPVNLDHTGRALQQTARA